MSRRDKLLCRLAEPQNDRSNRYDEVKALLLHYGYKVRSEGGSHMKFITQGSLRSLTLTEDKKHMITHYQSRQVREELQRAGILPFPP